MNKWMSNSRVLDSIPKDERAKQLKALNLDLGVTLPVERALGVQWDAESDLLGLQIKVKEPVYTRRGVLTTLGLVGPYPVADLGGGVRGVRTNPPSKETNHSCLSRPPQLSHIKHNKFSLGKMSNPLPDDPILSIAKLR